MKRNIIMLCLFLAFIIDMFLVVSNNAFFLDNTIYKIVISLKNDFITDFFKSVSFLASTKFIILLNIGIILIVLISKRTNLLLITIASILSGVINNLLKYIIKRDRPFGIALVNETFYSFPSGHTMISTLFYGTLCYFIWQSKLKYKKILVTFIISYIFLVGISRIYLGVHFASDILGGYLLASLILIILITIHEKYSKENKV